MDIAVFSSQELPFVLQTLTTVTAKPEALTPLEHQFLQVVNQLHQASVVVDDLLPITPTQIAAAITDPHHRKRLLQMAMVMAMVDNEITPSQQKALRSLAEVLYSNEQSLRVLHKAAREHKLLAQMDMTRESMGVFMSASYAQQGTIGLKKILAPLFYGGEDPDVAWKYRQLGLLPEGTLGRAFWEYYTQKRLSFPGEVGSIPERMVFHDFAHILSAYDTDPQGEIQQGAFQAGFIRENGFVFLLFIILYFHWGFHITPYADTAMGLFDISRVIHALQRGAACNVDLSDNWNFWEVVDVPVEELRDCAERTALWAIATPFHP